MNKEEHSNAARELHKQGCNCCQAVVMAWADKLPIEKKHAMNMAAPFGRGLAGTREICGCVSGMAMVCGLTGNTEMVHPLIEKFREENGDIVCGFFAQRSHRIVPCEMCMLEPGIFADIRSFITGMCTELKVSPYNEELHNGVLRHICIRKGHYSGEISVVLAVRRNVPELKKIAAMLMKRFPEIKGVTANINKEKTNVIFGQQDITLCGVPDITDTMLGKKFVISPKSFYQVNTPMAEKLYSRAKELAQPDGKTLTDLYCGIGTVGLTISDSAEELIGVEIVESAVENARENAALNGRDNAQFYLGDAEKITSLLREKGIASDIVTVDPARKGCDNVTLDNICAFAPERIVMISCNPATAARDCAYLEGHGYRTVSVQGVDMFPRTVHVECVVLLTKRK